MGNIYIRTEMWDDPKFRHVSRVGKSLYLFGLIYLAKQGTLDKGLFTPATLFEAGAMAGLANGEVLAACSDLMKRGLWKRVSGGYQIIDWLGATTEKPNDL